MAVGDKVRATRDVRSFDPKTMRIRANAIPSGALGNIIVQNDEQRFVSVRFTNGIIGTFGDGLVDDISTVTVVKRAQAAASSPTQQQPTGSLRST